MRRTNSSEPPSFRDVSLGHERLAPGWSLTAPLCVPAGEQQSRITLYIFKEYQLWPWDVSEGEGEGEVRQLDSSYCFNLQAGSGRAAQGGSRNLPAGPQALAATYLQPFILKTCGGWLIDPGTGSHSWGPGGDAVLAVVWVGCDFSRGLSGDAVLAVVWVGCRLSWGSVGVQAQQGSGGDAVLAMVLGGSRLSKQPGEAMLGNKRLQRSSPPGSCLFGLLPWEEVCLPLQQPWAGSFPS